MPVRFFEEPLKMQIELPTFVKTPSVKSLFDAVISASSQHRRFSFASSARSLLSIPISGKDVSVDEYEGIPEAVIARSPQEEQGDFIQKMVNHITSNLMVEDDPTDSSFFLGSAIPPITLLDYLERLVKYVNQWDEDTPSGSSTGIRCCLMAIEYLESSKVKLTPRSVHRYFMSAVLVAIKTTEDFAISNKFWGDVGGCKLEDVNRMEIAFCQLLNWNLTVSSESFLRQKARFSTPIF